MHTKSANLKRFVLSTCTCVITTNPVIGSQVEGKTNKNQIATDLLTRTSFILSSFFTRHTRRMIRYQ